MPKKFAGENTKAVAAKARKNAAKEEEQLRKEKEKEDELWKDDDKNVNRKLQRKEQQEKKKQEQLLKKAELRNLAAEEEKSLKAASQPKQPASKLTRAQIQEEQERRAAAAAAAASTKKKELATHIEKPLEENINRVQIDGLEARTITEAISILSTDDKPEDNHPEKRMKALYALFEAANLPRLKEENPSLRLSQLKQLLFKEWQKSPENPLNQKTQD